ncbi:1401_t:CDS:10, partial [Cetraspora pellucida]
NNNLPYNQFHVNTSYDGSLVIKVIDDINVNRYKGIHTILPNGTAIDINLDFSHHNNISVGRIYPLTMKLYLLLYDGIVNGSNQVTGMIIDWNKQIIKDQSDNNVTWTLYNLQQQDNIGVIANNSFNLPTNSTLEYVFPIVDGSYGFVISEISNDNSTSIPNIYLYYKFLSSTTHKVSENFLLYFARNISSILYVSCSPSYSEDGNTCMISTPVEKSQSGSTIITYQIDFLSSGSVVNLQSRYKQFLNSSNGQLYFNIKQLFYGGSIITSWTFQCIESEYLTGYSAANGDTCKPKNLTGYIIPPNGNEKQWDLLPISLFSDAVFDIMKNNTYILYIEYGIGNWSIFSFDLPKFREDFGYENPNIISVYPRINDTILPYTTSVNISFTNSITNKIQKFYSGNSEDCAISNNTNSVLCNISTSIFNQWNSSYMIVVDNNFVKYSLTDEPIYGIVESLWTFNTNLQTQPVMHSDSAVVIVRLTGDGTTVYNSLSSSEKPIFLNGLQNELVESIPTTHDRLRLTNRIQYDPSSQYLIQIEILAPNDNYQTPVYQIIKDMNALIKEKDTSIMSMNNHTKYLDSSYGVTVNLNLWDDIKFKLLGLLIGFIVLSIIALWARHKSPEGSFFTIFSMTFILLDLIMDILFIVKNGNDVPLVTSELQSNKPFEKWFGKYSKFISIFTMLSISDIALLECLTSKFGGFELFDAPFSANAQKLIFWGTTINIFIENIPQFIIQCTM